MLITNSVSQFLFHLLMRKYPKLDAVLLATIDISKYLPSNNLFLYVKAIQNYLFIQSINKQTYTHKEAAYIYSSHLDSDKYMSVKDTVRAVIESQVGATIQLKYMVPDITITVS